MPGLIEEIQSAALDTKVPVDALLRRTKLAAAKLQLPSLEVWVEQELNGYRGNPVPQYRKARGQVAAWNPYNGWIPVQFGNQKVADAVTLAPLVESISAMQDLLDREGDGQLHYSLSENQIAALNKMMNFETPRIIVQLQRGHIVHVVETVRNMVLDWAIEMEKKGVIGEGLSFNSSEKRQAQDAMATLHVGSIGQFIGNLGNGNSSGYISGNQSGNSDDVFRELIDLTRQCVHASAEQAEIIASIEQMKYALADKRSFAEAYGRFLGNVANHIAVFGPVLSRVSLLLS